METNRKLENPTIEAHSSGWLIKYNKEYHLLKSQLGNLVNEIQHIGSTAIPNMRAKPIIDIMMGVKSLDEAGPIHHILEQLGYIYKPDMSSTERLFFRKGNPVEFHLSIVQPDHTSFWERQILFRDFLINNPEYADEYEKIKIEAIKETPESELHDLSRSKFYSSKKGPFIEKILKLAQEKK